MNSTCHGATGIFGFATPWFASKCSTRPTVSVSAYSTPFGAPRASSVWNAVA